MKSAGLGVALLLGLTPAVQAEPSRRVVVWTESESSAALRLQPELRFVELEPVIDRGREPNVANILDALRASESKALVHLSPEGVEVFVLVDDQLQTEHIANHDGWESQVAELLHARLLAFPRIEVEPTKGQAKQPAQQPAQIEAKPAAKTLPPVAAKRRAFSLRVAGGPSVSSGGLGRQTNIWLATSVQVRDSIEVDLTLAAPPASSTLTAKEGSADVRVGLALLGLRWMAGRARLRPCAWLGTGAAIMQVHGVANVPFASRDAWTFSLAGAAGAGAILQVSERVRLQLDGLVGTVAPRPVVDFADHQVASWGRPFAAVTIGVGARL